MRMEWDSAFHSDRRNVGRRKVPDNTAPDGAAAPSAEVSRAAGATSDALAAAAPAGAQGWTSCYVPFSPSSWDSTHRPTTRRQLPSLFRQTWHPGNHWIMTTWGGEGGCGKSSLPGRFRLSEACGDAIDEGDLRPGSPRAEYGRPTSIPPPTKVTGIEVVSTPRRRRFRVAHSSAVHHDHRSMRRARLLLRASARAGEVCVCGDCCARVWGMCPEYVSWETFACLLFV